MAIKADTRIPKEPLSSDSQARAAVEQTTELKPASVFPHGHALPGPARLQAYRPAPLQENLSHDPHPLVNWTFDLGPGSLLPAVLAAPETTSDPGAAMTPAAAAAATLLEQFIESNAQPQSLPAGSDPLAVADQHWQNTVKQADERYRALFGKDAYLRQSLQAARVLRDAPPAKD